MFHSGRAVEIELVAAVEDTAIWTARPGQMLVSSHPVCYAQNLRNSQPERSVIVDRGTASALVSVLASVPGLVLAPDVVAVVVAVVIVVVVVAVAVVAVVVAVVAVVAVVVAVAVAVV